ncbi:MAG: hypothetical protein JXR13_04030 [Thalassovita sp.]
MDADLILVIGLIIAGFAIPSVISAWSDARAPRVAALSLMLGGALAVYGYTLKPGGYQVSDVPLAFVEVIGRYLN